MADMHGEVPVARIDLFFDEATEPFMSVVPPAPVEIDTTALDDGPHVLRLHAYDTAGNVGRRTMRFLVQNGPGITVTGLRADERVGGRIALQLNAFSGNEQFDPVRAESSGPIPVWTWVVFAVIVAWAGWYGLENFETAPAYANTPTYEANPVASGGTSPAAGFGYAAQGAQLYTQNCAACHGASGAGVTGAFPPLAGDPVVTAKDPANHVRIVLKGLSGKAIGGSAYSSQMPSFAQLSDNDIAAIIDHERTSWGNKAPTITPDVVKRAR
jgi:mono/diheme cytochrome c family protein